MGLEAHSSYQTWGRSILWLIQTLAHIPTLMLQIQAQILSHKETGVGVELDARGDTVDFPYTGEFKVPGRTLTITGNVQMKSPPSSTDEETLSIGQFLAHGHNTTFKIARKINFRNDGMSSARWKKNNYLCGKSYHSMSSRC